jgi:hypothetical protein
MFCSAEETSGVKGLNGNDDMEVPLSF